MRYKSKVFFTVYTVLIKTWQKLIFTLVNIAYTFPLDIYVTNSEPNST